jgi:hypothetical protein
LARADAALIREPFTAISSRHGVVWLDPSLAGTPTDGAWQEIGPDCRETGPSMMSR